MRLLRFRAGCHQTVTKNFELRHGVPLGIEIGVRVAHGYGDESEHRAVRNSGIGNDG